MRLGQYWLDQLSSSPITHRGLHRPGCPENSLAAAQAAIAAGLGIECDVRLSRDGVAHIFHDAQLERLTGDKGLFSDLTMPEIAKLRLTGTDEAPPRLAKLLALCHATPLLIELKSPGTPSAIARLCAAVARDLHRHHGPAAVMSFDPRICRWFACHAPHIPRGLVISQRRMALAIMRSRPHFLACDVRDLFRATQRPTRLSLFCWTVRTRAQRATARRLGAQIIFEIDASTGKWRA